jgi:hypothetical protein
MDVSAQDKIFKRTLGGRVKIRKVSVMIFSYFFNAFSISLVNIPLNRDKRSNGDWVWQVNGFDNYFGINIAKNFFLQYIQYFDCWHDGVLI